ncbi:hypothetical protein BC828DRAFT_393023 [Blastocladiella britannica]|nr:hypothetical protein BC828DRAFT_393023 [Blastocladiella britannica]
MQKARPTAAAPRRSSNANGNRSHNSQQVPKRGRGGVYLIARREELPVLSPAAYMHHSFSAIQHAQRSFLGRRKLAQRATDRAAKLERRARSKPAPRTRPVLTILDDDNSENDTGGEAMDVDTPEAPMKDPREARRAALARHPLASVRASVWPAAASPEAAAAAAFGFHYTDEDRVNAAEDAAALQRMTAAVVDEVFGPMPPSQQQQQQQQSQRTATAAPANAQLARIDKRTAAATGTVTPVLMAPSAFPLFAGDAPIMSVALTAIPAFNRQIAEINAAGRQRTAARALLEEENEEDALATRDLTGVIWEFAV